MKEFILDPSNFALIFLISITYFAIFSLHLSNYKYRRVFGDIVVSLLFLISSDVDLPFLSYLSPHLLAVYSKTLYSSIIQISVYVAILLLLRVRPLDLFESLRLTFKLDFFLGILLILGVLSGFWSETPGASVRYGLVMVCITVAGVHTARHHNWEKISRILRWLFTSITGLSIITAVFFPSIGTNPKGWTGITEHPNSLGPIVALNIALWVVFSLEEPKNRKLAFTIIWISILTLIMTNSAGSWFTAIELILLITLLQFTKQLKPRWSIVAFLGFLLIAIPVSIFAVENYAEILAVFGKDPTFTGRSEFWPQLIERAWERPILGYGLGGFWQEWRGEENPAKGIVTSNGFIPPHAHQGFLELLLNLGITGFVLFTISYVKSTMGAFRFSNYKKFSLGNNISLIFLSFVLLANLSRSVLITPHYVWLIYAYTSARVSVDLKNIGKVENHKLDNPYLRKA